MQTAVGTVPGAVTATLPYALGTGNWQLEALASTSFVGTITLTGSSGTWSNATQTVNSGSAMAMAIGSAVGGQTPSVTATFSSVTGGSGNNVYVSLKAVRIS